MFKKIKRMLFYIFITLFAFSSNVFSQSDGLIKIPIKPDERKEGTCDLRGHKSERTYEKRKTGETHKFFDPTPLRQASSIKSARYEKPYLLLEFESKALHAEKEGEIILNVQKIAYEAQPGTTAAATALLLGIPLLLTPGRVLKSAFGCTDEILVDKEVSIKESKPTGNYDERNIEISHELTIAGLGETKKIRLLPIAVHRIDISQWVLQAEVNESTNLLITCNSCSITDHEPEIKLTSNNIQVQISPNLGPLRDEVIAQIKIENERRERIEQERKSRAQEEAKRLERLKQEELARKKAQEQDELKRKKLLEEKRQIFNL